MGDGVGGGCVWLGWLVEVAKSRFPMKALGSTANDSLASSHHGNWPEAEVPNMLLAATAATRAHATVVNQPCSRRLCDFQEPWESSQGRISATPA